MNTFDVIVIGSGGGAKISSPAAALGLKVALIEEGALGGTCLNRGCIPSKMLIYPAHIAKAIRDAKKFDIDANISHVEFKNIIDRISAQVDGDSDRIKKGHLESKRVAYYAGHAQFTGDKVIEVNGETLTAEKIFIATGARPFIPQIPGLEGTPFMTSTEALRNTELPKKLIIIGGGYIGCELGFAYQALGCEVEMITRDELLMNEDKDVKEEFARMFKKDTRVHMHADAKSVSFKEGIFTVSYEKSGHVLECSGDALLVAVGVKPNTDRLGLEKTTVQCDQHGFIKVDNFLETTNPGVYALGDVIGRYMFRHAVNFEGEYLFRTLFQEKKKEQVLYPPMPHAVFTQPEIASVGVTEQEAISKNLSFVTGNAPYAKSAMGMARLSDHGFVKVIVDKSTHQIIGAHIIGDDAATLIHELVLAMTMKVRVDELVKMIYVHPALSEVVRNAIRKAYIQLEG